MKAKIERAIFLTVITGLSFLVIQEGRSQVSLENQLSFEAQGLYDAMADGVVYQLIDTRPLEDDDNDDVGGYEYTHIPSSIPFPGCDEANLPETAKGLIQAGVPTIIVSAEGDAESYQKCTDFFKRARNLEGGMLGWTDEFFPEDEGEFIPPKMGGGGGCL